MNLARPPMGWNSWNCFRRRGLSARAVLECARSLVDSGMRDAGYTYVVVDDCWQAATRDRDGRLQAEPKRFPYGIAELADEIHEMGLKFGVYAVPGSLTCGQQYDSYPGDHIGGLGYEDIDARTFADWGVDYLKYDWCSAHVNDDLQPEIAFHLMREKLAATGRPIVLSISDQGLSQPWEWAPGVADLWRTTDDLMPTWASVLATLDQQVGLERYARPGAWNDPDMLQVGNGELTEGQNRAHFYLWAVLNAPLIAGHDVRIMSPFVRDLLCNAEVVAVDQDWGGCQGRRVTPAGEAEVWAKPMSDGGAAAVLLNRGEDTTRRVRLTADTVGLTGTDYRVRDLTSGAEEPFDGAVEVKVPPADAAMVRLVPRG